MQDKNHEEVCVIKCEVNEGFMASLRKRCLEMVFYDEKQWLLTVDKNGNIYLQRWLSLCGTKTITESGKRKSSGNGCSVIDGKLMDGSITGISITVVSFRA